MKPLSLAQAVDKNIRYELRVVPQDIGIVPLPEVDVAVTIKVYHPGALAPHIIEGERLKKAQGMAPTLDEMTTAASIIPLGAGMLLAVFGNQSADKFFSLSYLAHLYLPPKNSYVENIVRIKKHLPLFSCRQCALE